MEAEAGKTKILIVDDEPFLRRLLVDVIEMYDSSLKVIEAENGIEAVDIIKREFPQIVFLDIMMPRMNGFEVCRIVKKELSYDHVTIVMLSAKCQDSDKRQAIELGANGYITKPFTVKEITSKIREILSPKTS